jgi:hypothetical protein
MKYDDFRKTRAYKSLSNPMIAACTLYLLDPESKGMGYFELEKIFWDDLAKINPAQLRSLEPYDVEVTWENGTEIYRLKPDFREKIGMLIGKIEDSQKQNLEKA